MACVLIEMKQNLKYLASRAIAQLSAGDRSENPVAILNRLDHPSKTRLFGDDFENALPTDITASRQIPNLVGLDNEVQ